MNRIGHFSPAWELLRIYIFLHRAWRDDYHASLLRTVLCQVAIFN